MSHLPFRIRPLGPAWDTGNQWCGDCAAYVSDHGWDQHVKNHTDDAALIMAAMAIQEQKAARERDDLKRSDPVTAGWFRGEG
jgi:hypothetical protein